MAVIRAAVRTHQMRPVQLLAFSALITDITSGMFRRA